MEENKDRELAEEFVTVPKGTTVNKEKYERVVLASSICPLMEEAKRLV